MLAFLILCLSIVAEAAGFWNLLTSALMEADDNYYIGHFIYNADHQISWNFFHHRFLRFLGLTFQSIILLRFTLVLMPLIIGFGVFHIINTHVKSPIYAALVAVFLMQYPVSADQNFFLTGSHPTAGLVFVIIYLLLANRMFLSRETDSFSIQLTSIIMQGTCLIIASYVSPVFTLATLLVVFSTLFFVIGKLFRGEFKYHCIILLVFSSVPAVIYKVLYTSYHYAKIEGWTKIDLQQILFNLSIALQYVFLRPAEDYFIFKWIYIAIIGSLIALLIIFLLKRKSTFFKLCNSEFLAMSSALFIASILSFGPVSIVTSFLPRYTMASFVLGGMLIFLILGKVIFYSHSVARNEVILKQICLFSICAFALTALINNIIVTQKNYQPLITGYQSIKTHIQARKWNDDDQIIMILPKGELTSTFGLNHWSTWYLRILSKNSNIIGLVGNFNDRLHLGKHDVFVEEYTDYSSEYVENITSKASRIRMKGLERDRATYAYSPNKDGKLVSKSFIYWNKDEIKTIPPGGRMDNVFDLQPIKFLCQSDFFENNFLVTLTPELPHNLSLQNQVSEVFTTYPKSIYKRAISSTTGEIIQVDLEISYTADQSIKTAKPYGNTYPPMPLLTPGLAIYAYPNSIEIVERDGILKQRLEFLPDSPLKVSILGCSGGAGFLFIDNQFFGALQNPFEHGEWTFGKGFLDRHWAGTIKYSVQTFD